MKIKTNQINSYLDAMVTLVRKKSQDILNRFVDDVKIGHDSLKTKKVTLKTALTNNKKF